ERATLLRARRRQAVIFAVIAAMLALLFGRAAYWQIAHHAELAAWADAQQLRAIAVPTGRGAIYDANGRLLALSVTQDTVLADPDSIRSAGALETTAARLAVLVGLPPVAVRRQLDVPGAYVRLRDTGGRLLLLSQAQSDAVNAARQQGELTGVTPIPEVRRIYPEGALAAQILGFVSLNDGRGAYGVEQQYERTLAGQSGTLYTAVDE